MIILITKGDTGVRLLNNILGKHALGYGDDEEVYAVLEEDGTEIDDEEYFQLLPEKTILMILSGNENWSPSVGLQGYNNLRSDKKTAHNHFSSLFHLFLPCKLLPQSTALNRYFLCKSISMNLNLTNMSLSALLSGPKVPMSAV